MDSAGADERLCYSVRLARAFVDVLGARQDLAPVLGSLRFDDLDERVPIDIVHRVLDRVVEHTGDVDIGLKAARAFRLGDAGTIDYLVSSVDTIEQAFDVAARYMRLINDALRLDVCVEGNRASVRLHNQVPMPRAALDYQLGAVFRTHIRQWLATALPEVRVMIPYESPGDLTEYDLTFSPAKPAFQASFSGFEFDRRYLDAPLEKADSRFHNVLRKHADRSLNELSKSHGIAHRVREAAHDALRRGVNPTAPRVAKLLGMSISTLGRRLEAEEVTFKQVVDELKKQLALGYLAHRDLGPSEVALLLGFSQVSAFHRAFRRWTGRTPSEYRRAWRS